MLTPHCMTRRPGLFVVWEHVRTYVRTSLLYVRPYFYSYCCRLPAASTSRGGSALCTAGPAQVPLLVASWKDLYLSCYMVTW